MLLLKSKILSHIDNVAEKIVVQITKVLPIKFVPTVIGVDIGTTSVGVDAGDGPTAFIATTVKV
jgi:hypothetical protein